MAGSNVRDWATLNRILAEVRARTQKWVVHLVGVETSQIDPDMIGGSVILHQRLDTDAYQKLLATSWAMLMPVLACTANNAALESRAAGTMLIGSRVPGLKSYEDPSWDYFDSAEEAVALMAEVADNDPQVLAEKGLAIRQRAMDVDWTAVARQTSQLYRRVLSA
jgi:glycosyltransferase involved in cell wall biosynthesis